MVKMTNGGITIQVNSNEVDFYKRAGYVVVKDAPTEPVAPEPEEEPEEESTPAPKKSSKKGK